MPLINFGRFRNFYIIKVKCKNCFEKQELKIPKGAEQERYIESENAECTNCGCNKLEKFDWKDGVPKV